MKKKVSLFLVLALVFSFAASLTSCDYFRFPFDSTSQSSSSSSSNTSIHSSTTDGDHKQPDPSDPGSTKPDKISPINVIMINDNHGILNEEKGSLDKIASGINYYDSLGDIVKIANGDMFQGTYMSSTLRGLPMLDALNAMNFDAFVIGNHEFDWGLEEMKKYKDGDTSNGEASFPFLGANIYDKRTNEMVDWFEPYAVIELSEVTVGIIGIIGDVETSILRSNVEDYDFVDPTDIVRDLAAELRTERGCDAVIVSIHGDNRILNQSLAAFDGDSRIDGIFTGHSHTPTDEEIVRDDGSSVCVLQNGGYGESLAVLTLEFDENKTVTDTDGNLNYTDTFTSTGILSGVFAKYGDYISIGDEVILTTEFGEDRYDVAMAVVYSMYEKYDVAYSFINSGGVRAGIDAGDVTYADLFQILPFENEVYIITMRGRDLRNYLNNLGSVYYWGIGTNAINNEQEYQIAIVDYLFQSYYFDDYRTDTYFDTNDLIRDVFIDYIKACN